MGVPLLRMTAKWAPLLRWLSHAGVVALLVVGQLSAGETFTSHGELCPPDDRRNRALLVAVREYDFSWEKLEHVGNEVQQLSEALSPHFANPDVLPNPSSNELSSSLSRLFQCAGRDDRLLFYYAGHGFSRPRVTGLASEKIEAYLVTRDTPDPQFAVGQSDGMGGPLDGKALSVSRLLDHAYQSNARDVLIVLDACQVASPLIGVDLKQQDKGFNQDNCGAFVRSMNELADVTPLTRQVLDAAFSAMQTRNLITSGFAAETVTAQSTFAEAFRDGLTGSADAFSHGGATDPDGEVDANELVMFIHDRLARLGHRQIPQLACGTPKLFSFAL